MLLSQLFLTHLFIYSGVYLLARLLSDISLTVNSLPYTKCIPAILAIQLAIDSDLIADCMCAYRLHLCSDRIAV